MSTAEVITQVESMNAIELLPRSERPRFVTGPRPARPQAVLAPMPGENSLHVPATPIVAPTAPPRTPKRNATLELVTAVSRFVACVASELVASKPSTSTHANTDRPDETMLSQMLDHCTDKVKPSRVPPGARRVMVSDSGSGFLLYGANGRSWVAMGDSAGSADERRALGWRFREAAAQHGADAIFYNVTSADFPLYVDLGLRLIRIGEAARVLVMEPHENSETAGGLYPSCDTGSSTGLEFAVLASNSVTTSVRDVELTPDSVLAALRARWPENGEAAFDSIYLAASWVAVIRRGTEVVAMANLWSQWSHLPRRVIAMDKLRIAGTAPKNTRHLFENALNVWIGRNGFTERDLGLVPLAGMRQHRLAPLLQRVGATIYRHSPWFSKTHGRLHDDLHRPLTWEPRYLAVPHGLALPRMLPTLATLLRNEASGAVVC